MNLLLSGTLPDMPLEVGIAKWRFRPPQPHGMHGMHASIAAGASSAASIALRAELSERLSKCHAMPCSMCVCARAHDITLRYGTVAYL